MKHFLSLSALACVFLAGGCVSWKDQAQADALSQCDRKADPDERRTCRETVIAAAESKVEEGLAKAEQDRQKREECTRLQRVYGDPSDKKQTPPC